MRDSLEDYEYLYLLNSGAQPVSGQVNIIDGPANKIVSGLTSYTRDDDYIYNLRRLIGLKLGGEISDIPNFSPPALHPRAQGEPGKYYINFQDPKGSPSSNPLVVADHEYMKIGWSTYDLPNGTYRVTGPPAGRDVPTIIISSR